MTKLDVPLNRYHVQGPATGEEILSLLRRLAADYLDDIIAGILNRQGRKTAYGERFTAQQVGSLRRTKSCCRLGERLRSSAWPSSLVECRPRHVECCRVFHVHLLTSSAASAPLQALPQDPRLAAQSHGDQVASMDLSPNGDRLTSASLAASRTETQMRSPLGITGLAMWASSSSIGAG